MRTFARLIERYPELDGIEEELERALDICLSAYRRGGKLLLCGNGGSAADCDHIVGELMKGFMSKRPLGETERLRFEAVWPGKGAGLAGRLQGALPALSLVAHGALTSAYANDVDPEMIYAQQVYGYAKPEDALIAISTSGNSASIVCAAQVARVVGIPVIGFTGSGGGKLRDVCDVAIRVPYERTPDIQERHLPIYHALCIAIEEALFPL
ncbi:D-sedoheptulose-7-phosphate isomerase [Cohnella fermenti]|uniref:SIS domain-containing protein n=1 Tax=Cohnella fermenti TaxID=2565925 RepID=A0A4S4BH21_9BACL|nr:SIS domain-containing protein [Cohnella fermenti]THF73800.1 SIS domain-containing protein [Cohnella fermenti]